MSNLFADLPPFLAEHDRRLRRCVQSEDYGAALQELTSCAVTLRAHRLTAEEAATVLAWLKATLDIVLIARGHLTQRISSLPPRSYSVPVNGSTWAVTL